MRRFSLQTWMLVVLFSGLAWRVVRYGLVFPLFGDEAFVAVHFEQHGFDALFEPFEHQMVVPPVFVAAEAAVTRVLGAGERALRLLPWLAGLVGFLAFARLARRTLGNHAALVSVAILAASYYPVRHAAEVKPYGFDFFVAVVLIGLAARVLAGDERSWAPLGWAALVSVWCSYPAAFVAGGAFLVLALERDDRRRAFVWGAATGLSFVAMYWTFGRHQQWGDELIVGSQWEDDFPPSPRQLPLWLLRKHTGNMFAYPNGGRDFGSSATTLLVIAGAVSMWRRGRSRLVALLLSSLPLMLLAATLHKYPYGGTARTNQHLVAPICLLGGVGLVAVLRTLLRPRRAAIGVRVFAGLMALLAILGAVSDVRQPFKSAADLENRSFARELGGRVGPADRVVFWGRFGGAGVGPDLLQWGGSAARMRYYLLRELDAPIAWGPVASSLEPGPRTFLLAYRDNEVAFPSAAWEDYSKAIDLGEPVAESVTFKGVEGMQVLVFPAR